MVAIDRREHWRLATPVQRTTPNWISDRTDIAGDGAPAGDEETGVQVDIFPVAAVPCFWPPYEYPIQTQRESMSTVAVTEYSCNMASSMGANHVTISR